MSKVYKTVSSCEFAELIRDTGTIESDLKQMFDEFRYLNDRLSDLENPITDGEFDWWTIYHFRLMNIYHLVYDGLTSIEGLNVMTRVNLLIESNKLVSDLSEKIRERRELKIKDDTVLDELINQVRQIKLIVGNVS